MSISILIFLLIIIIILIICNIVINSIQIFQYNNSISGDKKKYFGGENKIIEKLVNDLLDAERDEIYEKHYINEWYNYYYETLDKEFDGPFCESFKDFYDYFKNYRIEHNKIQEEIDKINEQWKLYSKTGEGNRLTALGEYAESVNRLLAKNELKKKLVDNLDKFLKQLIENNVIKYKFFNPE